MTDKTNNRQLFFEEAEFFSERIRHSLHVQISTQSLLKDSIQIVADFKNAAVGIELDSFDSIIARLEKVLFQHSTAQTLPSPIELELVALAVDWLDQLVMLYGKDLPEPKSLISELLYTFDLVDHSREAVSLAELVSDHAEQGEGDHVDPFSEDPAFVVENRRPPSRQDPFIDDPGFGLEFDLLQRTLNLASGTRAIVSDPFNGDPSLNVKIPDLLASEAISETQYPSYDLFEGDPPLLDEPDNEI